MPQHSVSTADEVKIVAMMARGDKYPQIQAQMLAAGSKIGKDALMAIKKRNKENFLMLKKELRTIERDDAMAIKEKANSLLKKKLDESDKESEALAKAHQDYKDNKITYKEYTHLLDKFKPTTVPELVMVSKEMHNQSKIEPDTPTRDPENIKALAEAIEAGDEMVLNQLIFKKGESNAISPPPEAEPPQSIPTS